MQLTGKDQGFGKRLVSLDGPRYRHGLLASETSCTIFASSIKPTKAKESRSLKRCPEYLQWTRK